MITLLVCAVLATATPVQRDCTSVRLETPNQVTVSALTVGPCLSGLAADGSILWQVAPTKAGFDVLADGKRLFSVTVGAKGWQVEAGKVKVEGTP